MESSYKSVLLPPGVAADSERFRLAIPTAPLGHLQRVSRHLEDLRNIDPVTRETSLLIAAGSGRIDVCEWLIDNGHDEGEISRGLYGDTVVHVSAEHGFSGIMELYLSVYPFVIDWVNAQGMSPLHTAALKGQSDSAEMLIEYGLDVNAPDYLGNLPLHYASNYGHDETVKLLIFSGSNTGLKNKDGFTPRDYAFSHATARLIDATKKIMDERAKNAKKKKLKITVDMSALDHSLPDEHMVHHSQSQLGLGVSFDPNATITAKNYKSQSQLRSISSQY